MRTSSDTTKKQSHSHYWNEVNEKIDEDDASVDHDPSLSFVDVTTCESMNLGEEMKTIETTKELKLSNHHHVTSLTCDQSREMPSNIHSSQQSLRDLVHSEWFNMNFNWSREVAKALKL
jgi:hypothetical protein